MITKQLNKSPLSTLFLFVALLSLQKVVAQEVYLDQNANKYAETITASELKSLLTVLAADDMEGRETGLPGQKKAAKWLTTKFKEKGALPAVTTSSGKSYLQKFVLEKQFRYKSVSMKIGKTKLKFLKDFFLPATNRYNWNTLGKSQTFNTRIIGHLNDSTETANFPENTVAIFVEAEGKPKPWMGAYFQWANKAKAAGVIILIGDYTERAKDAKDHFVKKNFGIRLMKPENASGKPIAYLNEDIGIKALNITKDDYQKLLKDDKEAKNVVQQLNQKAVTLEAGNAIEPLVIETENVVAIIPGSDLSEEYLVFSAHYDHIGVMGGEVYNGADDDGSGTCALLEIAEAFAQAKKDGNGPRRSVVFIAFTGEEKGLLGSEYYSENPVFPMEKTITNLNIDMIGRVDDAHKNNDRYVYTIGPRQISSRLSEVQAAVNKQCCQLDLDSTFDDINEPNRFFYRSDHYNFAKKNVPALFFFTGVHEDYHQPGDEVHKILFPKYEAITRLVFNIGWSLANDPVTPKPDLWKGVPANGR